MTGAQGWQYYPGAGQSPTQLRGNDGYKMIIRGGFASGGPRSLFAIWGGDSIKMFNETWWKTAAVPDAIFNPNLFAATNLGIQDIDVSDNAGTLWAAGAYGLYKAQVGAGGAWAVTNTYTDVGALFHVALSRDQGTVFVSNKKSVFAFDVASSSFNNGGQAIASLVGTNEEYRGLAAVPSLSPSMTATPTQTSSPSQTPSNTATPPVTRSQTGTVSPGATPTGTASITTTPTPSNTPSVSATASPTGTMTSRGGPLPSPGFVVVEIGNGIYAVPDVSSDFTVRISLSVYSECGTGCSMPQMERRINPWYSPSNG